MRFVDVACSRGPSRTPRTSTSTRHKFARSGLAFVVRRLGPRPSPSALRARAGAPAGVLTPARAAVVSGTNTRALAAALGWASCAPRPRRGPDGRRARESILGHDSPRRCWASSISKPVSTPSAAPSTPRSRNNVATRPVARLARITWRQRAHTRRASMERRCRRGRGGGGRGRPRPVAFWVLRRFAWSRRAAPPAVAPSPPHHPLRVQPRDTLTT